MTDTEMATNTTMMMIDAETATKPSSRNLWVVLVGVAVSTSGILAAVWLVVNPAKDTLWYEVAKTSLQVLGIAVIGGIVTFATTKFQQDRQNADQKFQAERQRADEKLERRREEFDSRTALLDRASRCAQKMYVTCQHVRRVQVDHGAEEDQGVIAEVQNLLDEVYRDFSAEAHALEMELGARYGIRMTIEPKDDVTGEAYLRWHQINDLLTVYYFALCGNFRRDVLKNNSECHDPERHGEKKCYGELHSGLALEAVVRNPKKPSGDELRIIINMVRPVFTRTIPVLAKAIVMEKSRVVTDNTEDSGTGG